jgi:flavin reductase (DIM6/NTAB) family NADH-FMN oxidoreductase RutF
MIIEPMDLPWQERHALMLALISPRPLAFISTVGEDGVFNAAPFSAYASVCLEPPTIGVSISRRHGEKKDTLRNIEFSRDFVINIVDQHLSRAMVAASADYPRSVDEIEAVGLTGIRSERVRAPRIAEAPASMECQLIHILELGRPPRQSSLVIAEVVLVHARDELCAQGRVDPSKLGNIGRLAGQSYCLTTDRFELERPGHSPPLSLR